MSVAYSEKFNTLPYEAQLEVLDFIDTLFQKTKNAKTSQNKLDDFFALAGNIDMDFEAVEALREESAI